MVGTVLRAPFKVGVEDADWAGEPEDEVAGDELRYEEDDDDDEKILYKVHVRLNEEFNNEGE